MQKSRGGGVQSEGKEWVGAYKKTGGVVGGWVVWVGDRVEG